jgi:hypothetical protein
MVAATSSIADAGSTYEPWPWDWIVPVVPKRQGPPGPTRNYLRNLRRPDAYQHDHTPLCCDEGETVDSKFKVEPGEGPHPETAGMRCSTMNGSVCGRTRSCPTTRPTAEPVFVIHGVIHCFVRPRGGL